MCNDNIRHAEFISASKIHPPPNPLENSTKICHNKYMNRQHGVMNMEDVKTLATQGIEPNGGGGL